MDSSTRKAGGPDGSPLDGRCTPGTVNPNSTCFSFVQGVAADNLGNVYVSDGLNNGRRVRPAIIERQAGFCSLRPG